MMNCYDVCNLIAQSRDGIASISIEGPIPTLRDYYFVLHRVHNTLTIQCEVGL
jgi:hypothetical protein